MVTLSGFLPAGSRLIQQFGYDTGVFLELARDFQLRRTMAEVLSVLSVGHLLESFLGRKQARSAGVSFPAGRQ